MADGDLRLGEIFDLRLERARLAVLSACESGVPGLRLIDEVESLPSGLMLAGVPGVVASLWLVNDLSTALLMGKFYEQWKQKNLSPAQALRQAQIWLRDMCVDEKKIQELKRDLPEAVGTRFPADIADEFFKIVSLREFKHPNYWAAFTYTGL